MAKSRVPAGTQLMTSRAEVAATLVAAVAFIACAPGSAAIGSDEMNGGGGGGTTGADARAADVRGATGVGGAKLDAATPEPTADAASVGSGEDAALEDAALADADLADTALADAPGVATDDGGAGAVVWQNTGTIAPWGHVLKDPGCSIVEVSSPTYRGKSALKHMVTFADAAKLNVHCEVARDPVAVTGDDRYYGWAFMLGDDWPDAYDRSSAITQLTGRGQCWNQNDFIQLSHGLSLNDNTGGGADSCNPVSIGDFPVAAAPVSKGVWHRVVVHKLWKGDSTGALEIWFDGVKTVSAQRVATGFADNAAGYAWHCGVYAGLQPERLGTRTIYTDHFRIATSAAAADPARWDEP